MLQNVVANYGDGSNIWRNLVSLWCCVCVDSLSLFLLSFSIFASTSLSLSLSLFSSFNSILIWFSLYYIFWWNAYRKSNKFHILDDFVCVEFSFFVFFPTVVFAVYKLSFEMLRQKSTWILFCQCQPWLWWKYFVSFWILLNSPLFSSSSSSFSLNENKEMKNNKTNNKNFYGSLAMENTFNLIKLTERTEFIVSRSAQWWRRWTWLPKRALCDSEVQGWAIVNCLFTLRIGATPEFRTIFTWFKCQLNLM